jgi:adenosylmethionine-8-amino-7-oxononanoate aminotransferase
MPMTADELAALDRQHLWHPFTQQRSWVEEDFPIIERAEDTTLYDTEGNAYIDGVSSLWCNVHGHRHPAIDIAIKDQLDRVAHSTMLGLSHAPAVKLAKRLVDLAPDGLTRVFFSDNGSTACEIALKMAYQWWHQRGEWWRSGFVCLRDSYHGDTLGSVSVGGIELFHSLYRPLLFDVWQAAPGDADALRGVLAEHADRCAAVIVEPLVQGAAGIHLQPEGYLRAVRELCDEFGLFMICDEVATGFGRTGTMFACEHEAVSPDLMCVAKGLTGGYLPLAATLTTERVYEGFLGRHEQFRTFFHGHTYTGNPLACAAALASLAAFERERTLLRLQPKMRLLRELLDDVAELDGVAEVRGRGFMVGIDLGEHDPALRVGQRVVLEARRRGAIIRPLGDVIVLMPPLAISKGDLRRLVEITAASIEATLRQSYGGGDDDAEADTTEMEIVVPLQQAA